jgi:hypothetical protein
MAKWTIKRGIFYMTGLGSPPYTVADLVCSLRLSQLVVEEADAVLDLSTLRHQPPDKNYQIRLCDNF